MITRAREQAADFTARLEAAGAKVIALPLIQIVDPPSWVEVDRALDSLSEFDTLVFTSTNVANKWVGRAKFRNKQPVLPSQCVAAIGSATARRLQEYGIKVDWVPEKFNAKGILQSLDSNLDGRNFLLPRGDLAREELPRELRARGAQVREVVVYQTQPSTPDTPRGVEMIQQDKIDVITFASPSAVHHFVDWISPAKIDSVRGHFQAASIGPTTSECLREYGFEVAIEASPSTVGAWTDAIVRFFQMS